jgi:hypothetical protein
VAGLLAAEILLRSPMRQGLKGMFFTRYVTTVFGIALEGTLLGMLLPLGALIDGSKPVLNRFGTALGFGFCGAIVGGAMGFYEGLILAFPVASVLGMFRDEG